MMSGLLGSLLGFGGSIVPAITDHFKQKNEQKFELAKMEKMAELRAAFFDHELQMFETMASDKEHERLIEHDISINKGTGFCCWFTEISKTYHYILFLWIILCNRSNSFDGSTRTRIINQ